MNPLDGPSPYFRRKDRWRLELSLELDPEFPFSIVLLLAIHTYKIVPSVSYPWEGGSPAPLLVSALHSLLKASRIFCAPSLCLALYGV